MRHVEESSNQENGDQVTIGKWRGEQTGRKTVGVETNENESR